MTKTEKEMRLLLIQASARGFVEFEDYYENNEPSCATTVLRSATLEELIFDSVEPYIEWSVC